MICFDSAKTLIALAGGATVVGGVLISDNAVDENVKAPWVKNLGTIVFVLGWLIVVASLGLYRTSTGELAMDPKQTIAGAVAALLVFMAATLSQNAMNSVRDPDTGERLAATSKAMTWLMVFVVAWVLFAVITSFMGTTTEQLFTPTSNTSTTPSTVVEKLQDTGNTPFPQWSWPKALFMFAGAAGVVGGMASMMSTRKRGFEYFKTGEPSAGRVYGAGLPLFAAGWIALSLGIGLQDCKCDAETPKHIKQK